MFSLFKQITSKIPDKTITLDQLCEALESEGMANRVERIRNTPNDADRLKKKLPAFTPAGIFKERLNSGIQLFSNYIHCDLDKVKNVEGVKRVIMQLPYTALLFISPSGNGLKVFAKVSNVTSSNYSNVVAQFCAYVSQVTGCEADNKCKDIARLCFVSYDPKYYRNDDAELFDYTDIVGYDDVEEEIADDGSGVGEFTNKDKDKLFKYITNNVGVEFKQGSRNAFINKVVYRANRAGLDREYLTKKLSKYEQPDFSMSEIKAVIHSVYTNLSNEYGKYRGNYFARINGLKVGTALIDEKDKIKEGILFSEFSKEVGIYAYVRENSVKYVKVTNRFILEEVGREYIVKLMEDVITRKTGFDEVKIKTILSKNISLFSEERFRLLLPKIEPLERPNTLDGGVGIYFKDKVVEVLGNDFGIIEYKDLNAHVWKSNMLNYEAFEYTDEIGAFEQFCKNISGDEPNFVYLCKIIGYLISVIDIPSNRRAVILTDYDGTENPSGGTGKGILAKALSYCVNTVSYDGKALDLENFKFNKNTEQTQLTILQDTEKRFNFEQLFSSITDGIEIRKMYQNAFTVPPEKGGKFLITTNYLPTGLGSSHERRRYVFVMNKYYNDDFTPFDEFGHNFFYDWDKDEWDKFYSFMLRCISTFLNEPIFKGYKVDDKLKLMREVGDAFYEFCDNEISTDIAYSTNDLVEKYEKQTCEAMKSKRFMYLLQKYVKIRGYEIVKTRLNDRRRAILLTKK